MAFIDGSMTLRGLKKIREQGEIEPIKLGFESWNEYDLGRMIQFSRGSTVLIGGEPHHGKTYFTNEIVMQLMEKHDFKIALISTETGNVSKVFSIFYGLYIGKKFSKVRPDGKLDRYAMTDLELAQAQEFINQRLFIFKVNSKIDKYQSLDNIYKELKDTEIQHGITFDSLVIDPIYDIDDFAPKADEVKKVLTKINQECEENNRVDIVVNHVSESVKILDRKSGERRKLRALADEFYGGKNNQRKAMLQILIERPFPNENPDDPDDYIPVNQTNVHVLKAKPEGVAFLGVYPIFYDWKTRRYYESYNDEFKFSDSVRFKDIKPNKQIQVKDVLVEAKDAFLDLKTEDETPF